MITSFFTTQVEVNYAPESSDDPDLIKLLTAAATALHGAQPFPDGAAPPATPGDPTGDAPSDGAAHSAFGWRDGPAAELLRYVRSLLFRPMARERLGRLMTAAEGDRRLGAALLDIAGGLQVL
jgi:hypothetical protein